MLRWASRAVYPRHGWPLLIRTYASRNSHVRIADLLQAAPAGEDGVSVSIAGCIRNIKKQKRVAFAHIQDGSCLEAAQIILSPEHAAPFVLHPMECPPQIIH